MLLGEYLYHCVFHACPLVVSSLPCSKGLTSRCPEVFDKSPVSFLFFFHCPKFPVGNWCHSQGKPNIWKFHILQTGNTRGTKGHPPGWGESQSYNPHFLTSEAVLNPLKPSCPSLCALYFLYSFHGFQEDLKPCGHGFHSVCSAGWLAGPLKPQALL